MGHGSPQQRLTPEQRRRIEEEEARREAERAAEMARQRAQLQESELDSYVSRRMERELLAITEEQRLVQEEELRQSGGGAPQNVYLLLALALAVSLAVIGLLFVMGRH